MHTPNRHFMSLAALVLAVALVAGCATLGRDFPTDPIGTIQLGRTSKADIASIFGSPWRTGIDDGDTTWTYGYYRYRLFGETETRDLKIVFDQGDRVQSYSFNQSGPEE